MVKEGTIRVGSLSTRVYPDVGGPARHVYGLANALEHLGISNVLVSSRPPVPEHGIRKGIKVMLPIITPSQESNIIVKLLFMVYYLLFGTFRSLVAFFIRRVNIIHSHSPAITGIVGLILSRIMRIPLVYTVHGLAGPPLPWSDYRGSFFEHAMEALVLGHADSIIVVSDDYIPIIEQMSRDAAIYSIGSGVDTVEFSPSGEMSLRDELGVDASQTILVWVGNFSLDEKVRGVVDVIKALTILDKDGFDEWLLVLVGGGSAMEDIRQLVERIGFSSRTHFLGWRRDIPAILRSSDIFVLLSHHEGAPSALLEAISVGLPCVVTAVGNVPQIIDDAGYLTPPANIEVAAEHLRRLMSSPEIRQKMGARARQHAVHELSWAAVARSIAHVYLHTLKEKDMDSAMIE